MKSIEQVAEFHRTFDCETHEQPHVDSGRLNALRLSLLQEELMELEVALQTGEPAQVLDALTDLQYVLDGAYLAFGLAKFKDAALAEVHRSNMSKLWPDGTVHKRDDGKVLKPDTYSPANLEAVLAAAVGP